MSSYDENRIKGDPAKPLTHIKILDHGYVKYVDKMGDDLEPLRAARMSTDTLTGVDKTKDARLRNRLWGDRHTCYDAKTEVLVKRRGFVPWPDVTKEMELGVWDPKAQSLCYEHPQGLVDEEYEGQMYSVDHGGVDLLVTPSHNMWVSLKAYDHVTQTQSWSDYGLCAADVLGERSMVRYSKLAPYRMPNLKYDLARLRLYGFFIGDGYAGGSYRNGITFHLKKKRKVAYLFELCAELNLEIGILANNNYVVREDGITLDFREMFYTPAGNKRIPVDMQYMGQEASEALLEGLRASDGSEHRGTWLYSTSVAEVAHAVQLIALHAGRAAHVLENVEGMFSVSMLSRMTHPVINQGKQNVSWEGYKGRVYCAHTRTGILVVRRSGKIVLSGNSPFEMNELCVELQLPMFVLRQFDRHRTVSLSNVTIEDYDQFRKFTSRNEFSGRYSEMPDLYYIPELARVKGTDPDNKQGSKIPLSPPLQQAVKHLVGTSSVSARSAYDAIMAYGTASEIARLVLPQNQYTKIRLKANLLNWLNFLDLRLRADVQEETRAYAQVIAIYIRALWPECWQVFEEHTLYGSRLSSLERASLASFFESHTGLAESLLEFLEARGTSKQAETLMRKLGGPEDDLLIPLPHIKQV